jgi:hypothetical protein
VPCNVIVHEHDGLRSRATDQVALTQPEELAWNAKGYQMNAMFPVPVTVG